LLIATGGHDQRENRDGLNQLRYLGFDEASTAGEAVPAMEVSGKATQAYVIPRQSHAKPVGAGTLGT
jgi:hypothetical protein